MMFCELLRTEREKRQLSQRALAVKAGLSNTYIAKLEAGVDNRTNKKPIPTIDTIQRLETALNLPKNYLIDNSEYGALRGASIHEQIQQTAADHGIALSPKNERDIMRRIQELRDDLTSPQTLMLSGGDVLDERTLRDLRMALEDAIIVGKIAAKKKFTPKKYRHTLKKD